MKAVISTTYDDKYLYFLPIVTFLWNKLGVDVICFAPRFDGERQDINNKMLLVLELFCKNHKNRIEYFSASEHKEATYAQCSRLYGACLDLPEDEVLITSDIDMGVFNSDYLKQKLATFDIFGTDLVPVGQYPMCYISATVRNWRLIMGIGYHNDKNGNRYLKTYQQCLDELVGVIECQDFRGNQWSLDQDTAFKAIGRITHMASHYHLRAKEGTQFSTLRYDRDDSYILDMLSPDTIDYHMNRPGYEDKNFETILTILKYHYPLEDFTWLETYNQQYKKLL